MAGEKKLGSSKDCHGEEEEPGPPPMPESAGPEAGVNKRLSSHENTSHCLPRGWHPEGGGWKEST